MKAVVVVDDANMAKHTHERIPTPAIVCNLQLQKHGFHHNLFTGCAKGLDKEVVSTPQDYFPLYFYISPNTPTTITTSSIAYFDTMPHYFINI